MEKIHPDEAYYKPREAPTSARNNYIKCRICLSYFKDEQVIKSDLEGYLQSKIPLCSLMFTLPDINLRLL
jgi:hypothetical protein